MRARARIVLLLALTYVPTSCPFVLQLMPPLRSKCKCEVHATERSVADRGAGRSTMELGPLQPSYGLRASTKTPVVPVSPVTTPANDQLPECLQSDAVSHIRNPSTGSEIWLLGIIHQAEPYVQLVQSVIREIKPQVVMLELDAERTFLLPPGTPYQGEDKLWWWKPAKAKGRRPGAVSNRKKAKPRKTTRNQRNFYQDEHVGVSEIWTAGREAQACRARVLLGDRSNEVSKRREREAERADSQMLAEITGTERKELERAGKELQKLTALIERRRSFGFEVWGKEVQPSRLSCQRRAQLSESTASGISSWGQRSSTLLSASETR
ncbi:unnamed protein product [Ectocarpus sp. CCAP 1310/34]|nr:unnamed protein product [Ectocarpus sp. CCAP 1310/34]